MSDVTFAVELAVDELLTNTISYGCDDDGEHRIDLSLRLEGGTLVCEIVDDGRAFDPLLAPQPDLSAPLEERAVGGLGIYLVRKTMDAMACRRENERNVVTLRKSTPFERCLLTPRGHPPGATGCWGHIPGRGGFGCGRHGATGCSSRMAIVSH